MRNSNLKARSICEYFFKELEKADLVDHPDLFTILDDYARNNDYMICAEQKGIFGTRIFFGRVSQWEK